MPTNVSVEYARARGKFENAKTDLEKLLALQEMRSTAPSHKGGEKLRAEISKKIAQLKSKIERSKEQAKKAKGPSVHVKKEGAGQIVLVGLPNAGKSFVLKALTNAEVEVAPYPFTTKAPVQGMLDFKGAKVQLVEVPAIIEGSAGGKAQGAQLFSVIRNSDAAVLVVRDENKEGEVGVLLKEFEKSRINIAKPKPLVEVKKSEFKGIEVVGEKHLQCRREELEGFLKSAGMQNARVILGENAGLKEIADALEGGISYKKALVLLNGSMESAALKIRGLKALPFNEGSVERVKEEIFSLLEKILVYTKKPGAEPDFKEPLVLKKGTTVEEMASMLHKGLARSLKFVRVWGSAKFPGQRVSKEFKLSQGDVIEIGS